MTYRTELMTFTVKAGKEARALEWMAALVERQAECEATLERERMHYECIFRSEREHRMRLSWFEVRGAAAADVRTSRHPIDELHLAFWDECIDRDVPPETFEHVVSFVPDGVRRAVEEHDAL